MRYKPSEWYECKRKVAHQDWWNAYLHVRRLQRLNPYKEVAVYGCDYCGALHVGSPYSVKRTRRAAKKFRKLVDNPLFRERAPLDVQRKITAKLEQLEKSLAAEL